MLETRCGGVRGTPTEAYKETRNRYGLQRESEGFIVPFEGTGQHNPTRGKEPYFVHATNEWKERGLPQMLTTPEKIRTLQRKLYRKAKQDTACRFHALYDKVYRADILSHAYALVRANKGSAGIDGLTFVELESREEVTVLLMELEDALRIWSIQSADNCRLEESACLTVKNIGKPCAGKPHARFDEGGLVEAVTEKLFRHRQTKGAETDKLSLTLGRPALYPTFLPELCIPKRRKNLQSNGYSTRSDLTYC